MNLANASTAFTLRTTPILPPATSFPCCVSPSFGTPTKCLPFVLQARRKRKVLFSQSCAVKNELSGADDGRDVKVEELDGTLMYSFIPLPLLVLAALPGGVGAFRHGRGWNMSRLPHSAFMWQEIAKICILFIAVVDEEKAMAKDLHPRLLGGMFFFFALGATGGITSLLTSDKPIFESPHAVTGFISLIQTSLPTLFEGKPGLRNVF